MGDAMAASLRDLILDSNRDSNLDSIRVGAVRGSVQVVAALARALEDSGRAGY
jgi:hypothetical protein